MRTLRALLVVLGCLALWASAAGADWLVMRDGSRVETKGPWRVEGNKVLFDLPNGTLSVLRASEVDLEASEAASAPQPSADDEVRAEAPPAPKPEPVLVLTDKDIPRALPVDEDTGLEAVSSSTSTGDIAEPLVVDSWEKTSTRDGFGVEIRGTLSNRSAAVRGGIVLQVEIEDFGGNEHQAQAFLRLSALEPGGSTTFRAVYPNVDDVDGTPTFSLESVGLAADADGIKVIDDASGQVRQTITSLDDAAAGAAASGDDGSSGSGDDP
ncbi:MAG: hypothetical protein AAGC60_11735 [Acidobacteriota bacterium]